MRIHEICEPDGSCKKIYHYMAKGPMDAIRQHVEVDGDGWKERDHKLQRGEWEFNLEDVTIFTVPYRVKVSIEIECMWDTAPGDDGGGE